MNWNELMLEDSRQRMRDFVWGPFGDPTGDSYSEAMWEYLANDPLFQEEVCTFCGKVYNLVDENNCVWLTNTGQPVCERCNVSLVAYPKQYWHDFDALLIQQSKNDNLEMPNAVCHDCGTLLYPNGYGGSMGYYHFNGYGENPYYCDDCYSKYYRCNHCDRLIPLNEGINPVLLADGEEHPYCDSCYSEPKYHACYDCGDVYDEDDMMEIDGRWVCDSCREENYSECEICGIWERNNYGYWVPPNNSGGDVFVCSSCLYNSSDIERCDRCDEARYVGGSNYSLETVRTDDDCDEHWCDDCVRCGTYYNEDLDMACADGYEPEDNRGDIWGYHDYPDDWSFRDMPKDHRKARSATGSNGADSTNTLYMGVELEIDKGGEDWDNAIEITDAMGFPCDDSTELKVSHDGSLTNGFEIITMPCTLNYHKESINWRAGTRKAIDLGYKSHDAETCGLHVHVNRTFFLANGNRRGEAEKKMALVITNNASWLTTFSRRTNFNYCKFKDSVPFTVNDFYHSGDSGDSKDNDYCGRLSLLIETYNDHYSAINFGNSKTIEFRFFRGTLKANTIIASLQLVQMICECVKRFSFIQLCYVDFKFLKNMAMKRDYKEFLSYCEERGLNMLANNSAAA